MPVDRPEMQGTEKDGSRSTKYCVYCYAQGQFLNPDMTLAEMTAIVRSKLQEMKMPERFIDGAVQNLLHLERWESKSQPAAGIAGPKRNSL